MVPVLGLKDVKKKTQNPHQNNRRSEHSSTWHPHHSRTEAAACLPPRALCFRDRTVPILRQPPRSSTLGALQPVGAGLRTWRLARGHTVVTSAVPWGGPRPPSPDLWGVCLPGQGGPLFSALSELYIPTRKDVEVLYTHACTHTYKGEGVSGRGLDAELTLDPERASPHPRCLDLSEAQSHG